MEGTLLVADKDVLDFGVPTGGIMQIAYIVPNLEEAVERHLATLPMGPWFIFEHFPLLDYQHRGQDAEIDVSIAMAFSGSMCFELIMQNCNNDSVYMEIQQRKGWGFHHWAYASMDFDADIERYTATGREVALYGRAGPGARAAYIDTTDILPGMIELIEITDNVQGLFTEMQEAAAGWDGRSEPIRTFSQQ
ncbi:MAG: hypothetical protein ACJA09_001288 [Alcanivorax sp.]|jgi:hypothetical protein